MSDANSAKLLRKGWKWIGLLTALTLPLLKVCGFLTGHRLVTLEPGMSTDPATLLINLFHITAFACLAALTGTVFAALLIMVSFRKREGRAGWILDIGLSGAQIGTAVVLFYFYKGIWWADIGIVFCLVTLPQRWIPSFQKFISDDSNGVSMIGIAFLEGAVLALTVAGAGGFESFDFISLRNFEVPDFGLAAFGALYYGFLILVFLRGRS